jgi:uncharacterized membrane protein YeaQ/YmgE (transglycosylase-associated protein family)
MDLGGLIWALLIGGIIGWLASLIMKTNRQMGIIANIVVGVIGSALGYWLAPMLGIHTSSTVGTLGVALGGAVLLIVALRFVGIMK